MKTHIFYIATILFFALFGVRPAYAGVIYHADFETGDFRSLTGNTSWEGPIGAYFGKGVYHKEEVVSSPAIGKYAAALTIGSGPSTAAYLFTYSPVFPPSGKGMYAASYYVPSTITPSDWWNIWQWKSKDTTYDKPIINLNLVKLNGILQLRMSYVPGGISSNPKEYITQSTPVPFPTNTWVTITGYYEAKTDNTGLVRIYQNGTQIFEKTGIMTKPGNQPVLWSVNSYADAISPNPATIYVDEMIIDDVGSAPTITPTPSPTGIITPTSTPKPTATPSPSPKPTITPTPSPTLTVTPTPTPIGNQAPVWVTTSLPVGKKNVPYTANLVAYDPNSGDSLRMTSSSLPRGLSLKNCRSTIVNATKQITCTLTGTPKVTASGWIVAFLVTDSKGLKTQTKLNLIIN